MFTKLVFINQKIPNLFKKIYNTFLIVFCFSSFRFPLVFERLILMYSLAAKEFISLTLKRTRKVEVSRRFQKANLVICRRLELHYTITGIKSPYYIVESIA